jgi:hypothetical protein
VNQVLEQLLRVSTTGSKDWDEQLALLEFAYNNAEHRAAGSSPFFLNYGYHPLVPQKPVLTPEIPAASSMVEHLNDVWETTRKRLNAVRERDCLQANKHRHPHDVKVDSWVLLDTRNLNLSHVPSKLRPRFCGPFKVISEVTPVTFRLQLPPSWRLHNAFHVSLLRPYRDPNAEFEGREGAPPPLVLVDGEPEYEVDWLLAHRVRGRGTRRLVEFLVRWKGYDPSEDCWISADGLRNAPRPLAAYLKRVGAEDVTTLEGG